MFSVDCSALSLLHSPKKELVKLNKVASNTVVRVPLRKSASFATDRVGTPPARSFEVLDLYILGSCVLLRWLSLSCCHLCSWQGSADTRF